MAPATVHDLRRSYGANCNKAGIPTRTAQVMMRHANIQTTAQFYLAVDAETVRAAVDRVALGAGLADVG